MPMTIAQIHTHFVGEVSGLDLREPVAPEDAVRLNQALDRYGVLVFRGQNITDEQQLAFTLNFGEIELAIGGNVTKPSERRLDVKLADVSNLDQNGKVMAKDDRRRMFNLGNRLWHSDSSFRAVPAKYSLLSGRIVTTDSGNTEFADMRAAYDELDAKTKDLIEDMICEHSLIYSRGALGFEELTPEEKKNFTPVRQSLVRTHPVTGRKSLYLSAHIGQIIGMPRPEAMCLIRDLAEHATQPKFVHSHRWQQYDLVMWDNRQTMHRVRAFDDVNVIRDMRRTTIAGDTPTTQQVAA